MFFLFAFLLGFFIGQGAELHRTCNSAPWPIKKPNKKAYGRLLFIEVCQTHIYDNVMFLFYDYQSSPLWPSFFLASTVGQITPPGTLNSINNVNSMLNLILIHLMYQQLINFVTPSVNVYKYASTPPFFCYLFFICLFYPR